MKDVVVILNRLKIDVDQQNVKYDALTKYSGQKEEEGKAKLETETDVFLNTARSRVESEKLCRNNSENLSTSQLNNSQTDSEQDDANGQTDEDNVDDNCVSVVETPYNSTSDNSQTDSEQDDANGQTDEDNVEGNCVSVVETPYNSTSDNSQTDSEQDDANGQTDDDSVDDNSFDGGAFGIDIDELDYDNYDQSDNDEQYRDIDDLDNSVEVACPDRIQIKAEEAYDGIYATMEHAGVRPLLRLGGTDLYVLREIKTTSLMKVGHYYQDRVLLKQKNSEVFCICHDATTSLEGRCIHTVLFKKLQSGCDYIPTILGNNENHVYPTRSKTIYVYAKWTNETHDFAILTKKNTQKIYCSSCSRGCYHIDSLLNWKPELKVKTIDKLNFEEGEKGEGESIEQEVKKPISTKTFFLPWTQEEKEKMNMFRRTNYYHTKEHFFPPYDPNALCEHGEKFRSGNPIQKGWFIDQDGRKLKPTLITDSGAVTDINVYYRPSTCNIDGCVQQYDGQEDFILNVTGRFLITHTLVMEFLISIQYKPDTIHGFCQTKNAKWSTTGAGTMSEKNFRDAFDGFIYLYRMRDSKEVFTCYDCKSAPKMIITCDGIQMGSST